MTKRTPQLQDAILDGFAAGRSIAELCREHAISRSTFQNWRREDEDFAYRYELAQGDHAEALIDECMAIADAPPRGEDDRAHLRHARLRIDVRLRVARIHLRRHDEALERRKADERIQPVFDELLADAQGEGEDGEVDAAIPAADYPGFLDYVYRELQREKAEELRQQAECAAGGTALRAESRADAAVPG